MVFFKKKECNTEDRAYITFTRDNYIEKRLNDQIRWYSNKSKNTQNKYKRFTIATIFLNAFIPILVVCYDIISPNLKILAIISSSLISIFTGIIYLNNYHDLWLKYRTTCENLLHEKILYETNSGKYKNAEDSLELLITTCELIMDLETKAWLNAVNTENQSSTSS